MASFRQHSAMAYASMLKIASSGYVQSTLGMSEYYKVGTALFSCGGSRAPNATNTSQVVLGDLAACCILAVFTGGTHARTHEFA